MSQATTTLSADMKKLLIAQFLTAMADNAILFVILAMILQGLLTGEGYLPALQGCFLLAFVFLAPWVGSFADTRSKPQVLMLANVVKGLGTLMMLGGVEPLIAYAVVGIGAAAYSPAKYGILPEITQDNQALMKSNSWVEGSTIVAILLGTVVGAYIADISITMALILILCLYLVSAMSALWMSKIPPAQTKSKENTLRMFKSTIQVLLESPRARFSTLGVSLFWAAAVVLRLIIMAWAPVVLLLSTATDVSLLTLFIALGIACGALLAPIIIPMAQLRRARFAAYGLALGILSLMLVTDLNTARTLLFFTGICGGLFVVPINAVLQDIGHQSVGSGRAVAVQHFFENLAMLIAIAAYTWAAQAGVASTTSMLVLGVFVLIATMFIALNLPKQKPD
ncbi:MAG: lysophospholipid transporter LplT [Mariprofundaceae bacterium]|nr:lysophospholipid transporter LplT [Mariprofundaceae bacterium]